MSEGLVSMVPFGLCMQSREFSVVGWNIFLWIDLGLVLSSVRYFLMAALMLSLACLAVILYASFLVVLPIVASASIHCVCSVWLVGSGGMCVFKDESNVIISGWF